MNITNFITIFCFESRLRGAWVHRILERVLSQHKFMIEKPRFWHCPRHSTISVSCNIFSKAEMSQFWPAKTEGLARSFPTGTYVSVQSLKVKFTLNFSVNLKLCIDLRWRTGSTWLRFLLCGESGLFELWCLDWKKPKQVWFEQS